MDKVYTTGDVARMCKVHTRTVIRWIENLYLKGYKLPGRGDHRIAAVDLLRFLQENKMPVPEELQVAQKKKVLIVDDEKSMAKCIERVLARKGYETRIASGSVEAGMLLASFVPHVVTLDLNMPVVGGAEMVQAIRGNELYKHIRIVIVSASPREELKPELSALIDGFLEKPFSNETLVNCISKVVA